MPLKNLAWLMAWLGLAWLLSEVTVQWLMLFCAMLKALLESQRLLKGYHSAVIKVTPA